MIEISRSMSGYGSEVVLLLLLGVVGCICIITGFVALNEDIPVAAAIVMIIGVLSIFGAFKAYEHTPQREEIRCIIRGTIDWDEFTQQYEIITYEPSAGIFVVTEREGDPDENL